MKRIRRNGLHSSQRGAALLMAMMIVALVATLATAMVWQQWRAVQVESVERARTQSTWILNGALDWARLILREDRNQTDDLTDIWAVPLAEARLSTFLAADKDNTVDSGPEVFLSGSIVDAQARFNLRNLIATTTTTPPEVKQVPAQVAALKRLCDVLNVTDVSELVAKGMELAYAPSTTPNSNAPLEPRKVEQLAWMGVDPQTLAKLAPYVVVLPVNGTKVNLNTASREVIAAVASLDASTAARLVQARQGKPFTKMEDVKALIGGATLPDAAMVDFKTNYFEVRGRLRLDRRIIEETSIVHRDVPGGNVKAHNRQRESLRELPG